MTDEIPTQSQSQSQNPFPTLLGWMNTTKWTLLNCHAVDAPCRSMWDSVAFHMVRMCPDHGTRGRGNSIMPLTPCCLEGIAVVWEEGGSCLCCCQEGELCPSWLTWASALAQVSVAHWWVFVAGMELSDLLQKEQMRLRSEREGRGGRWAEQRVGSQGLAFCWWVHLSWTSLPAAHPGRDSSNYLEERMW